jgi:hypothetical protein
MRLVDFKIVNYLHLGHTLVVIKYPPRENKCLHIRHLYIKSEFVLKFLDHFIISKLWGVFLIIWFFIISCLFIISTK